MRVGVASKQTAFDAHDAEDDAVAEVNNLLYVISMLPVGAPPVFKEGANRHLALVYPQPHRRHVPHRIRTVIAHDGINIPTTTSIEAAAGALNQVGGRGLVRHQLV